CDNPKCVNPDHIFLGEPADNSADMVNKGRSMKGEKSALAKLSSLDVIDIVNRYNAGETQTSISRSYGVVQQQISRIVNQKRWGHVSNGTTRKPGCTKRVPEADIIAMYKLREKGLSTYEIAKKYDVSAETVRNIVNGKSYSLIYKRYRSNDSV
ncbi:MAG: hypothetical protein DRI61_15735, partial [Chloroflexi bacterium]